MEENPRRSPKARGMGSQNPWQQLALTVNPKKEAPVSLTSAIPNPLFDTTIAATDRATKEPLVIHFEELLHRHHEKKNSLIEEPRHHEVWRALEKEHRS